MTLSREVMLEKFLSADASFNGRFVTGVVTTGIYCLPSCGAKKPLPRNVKFFPNEEEAKGAGLRACRRCHPDHFYRDHDPAEEIATNLIADLRTEPASFRTSADLARRAGMSVRALQDLVRKQFQLTPAALLRREHVASAAALLVTTRSSLLDIADASGFDSVSAFHANFKEVTGMTPHRYRRLESSSSFTIVLPDGYRPADPLRMFGRDSQSRIERVDGATISKGVVLGGVASTLIIRFGAGRALCRVEAISTLPHGAMRQAHNMALRILGLTFDPAPFEQKLRGADRKLILDRKGLRIPQTADVFEGLLWSIVGQQVTVSFAATLRNRVVELCGTPLGNSLYAHPGPEDVARLDSGDLTKRQFSASKAEYLLGAARAAATGELPLEDLPHGTFPRAARTLLNVRGIGVWSANYILMRSCGFADCVPAGDTGLGSSLQDFYGLDERPDIPGTERLMEDRFSPYRSLATMHFWMRKSESKGKQ